MQGIRLPDGPRQQLALAEVIYRLEVGCQVSSRLLRWGFGIQMSGIQIVFGVCSLRHFQADQPINDLMQKKASLSPYLASLTMIV